MYNFFSIFLVLRYATFFVPLLEGTKKTTMEIYIFHISRRSSQDAVLAVHILYCIYIYIFVASTLENTYIRRLHICKQLMQNTYIFCMQKKY